MHDHGMKSVIEVPDGEPLLVGHMRNVLDEHAHEHHPLVQEFVVLEIVQQRARHEFDIAGQ